MNNSDYEQGGEHFLLTSIGSLRTCISQCVFSSFFLSVVGIVIYCRLIYPIVGQNIGQFNGSNSNQY